MQILGGDGAGAGEELLQFRERAGGLLDELRPGYGEHFSIVAEFKGCFVGERCCRAEEEVRGDLVDEGDVGGEKLGEILCCIRAGEEISG